MIQAFDTGIYSLFPRLLKYNSSRTLGSYLKLVDSLFDKNCDQNESFQDIIENLQDNIFFLKNGKKTVVKFIAEKMLRPPEKRSDPTTIPNKGEDLKSREVKVNVNRLAFAEFITTDFYDLQISLPSRKPDNEEKASSNVDSLSMDVQNKIVAFQVKYDLHADMFFLAEARSEYENLESETNAADEFRAVDSKLQTQIANYVKSKFSLRKEESKNLIKIDYAEGIKTKRLVNNQNNMVAVF